MRRVFAMILCAWACGWLAGPALGAPPGVILSVSDVPPTFALPPSGDGVEQLPAPRKAGPSWNDVLNKNAPEAAGICDCDGSAAESRGLVGLLRRINQRSSWQPIGQHPRMFEPASTPRGIPEKIDGPNGPRIKAQANPKTPTTLPQAFMKYLRCLRTHGQALKDEAKAAGAKKPTGTEKEKEGADKGGKSQPLDDKSTSTATQPPDPETPQPVPRPPPDALGAERGGRAINIEGETGPLGTGYGPAWYSAHIQGTLVDAVHDRFTAPYTGLRSLLRNEPHATSETTTFFFATRLWDGGEFVFNPEAAGGLPFSGGNGMAGFPNGEITRVGVVEPTPYFARMFFRQTIGFGGEQEQLPDGVNQVAGTRDVNHLTLAAGRFSMTDVADDNKFSHDPRTQFLNWAIMYNGAWDYPANVRGYTDGIAVDFNQKNWAIHYAIGAVSRVANGSALDPNFLKANGQVWELLFRYKINDHPGNLRPMFYLNHANMGNYGDALRLMPVDPNVTLTRTYRFKYGFGLSWDQEVTKDVGIFGRLGWNDDHSEAFMFTPIGRLAQIGALVVGDRWCRPNDQLGMAFDINGISKDHRRYLAAGGLDFNLGDGKLAYRPEMIVESFYNLGVTKNILFTLDFQEVFDPAYNRDRGPVTVFQGRFHLEF